MSKYAKTQRSKELQNSLHMIMMLHSFPLSVGYLIKEMEKYGYDLTAPMISSHLAYMRSRGLVKKQSFYTGAVTYYGSRMFRKLKSFWFVVEVKREVRKEFQEHLLKMHKEKEDARRLHKQEESKRLLLEIVGGSCGSHQSDDEG